MTMKIYFSAILLFLLFFLVNQEEGGTAVIENLQIDTQNSTVEFTAIGNPSMLTIKGTGAAPTGKLTISDEYATGFFEFDLNSLDTGINLRDRHMKEKYLEVAKENGLYAKTSFLLNKLILPKQESFTLENIAFSGVLKLHGVEKNVSGVASKITRQKFNFTTHASLKIKLSDFKIAIPSYAGITVAEEVDVLVKIAGTIVSEQKINDSSKAKSK
ncbi:MAG: YceI family protein [Oligoflexia bacterium]|nr:YceI family protein [Oligoflexia bacterium]